MGRASRRRQELREPPKSEAERLRRTARYARRAQRSASARGSSVAEYEAMAAMGSKYIVEALIARHNSRMIAVEKTARGLYRAGHVCPALYRIYRRRLPSARRFSRPITVLLWRQLDRSSCMGGSTASTRQPAFFSADNSWVLPRF